MLTSKKENQLVFYGSSSTGRGNVFEDCVSSPERPIGRIYPNTSDEYIVLITKKLLEVLESDDGLRARFRRLFEAD